MYLNPEFPKVITIHTPTTAWKMLVQLYGPPALHLTTWAPAPNTFATLHVSVCHWTLLKEPWLDSLGKISSSDDIKRLQTWGSINTNHSRWDVLPCGTTKVTVSDILKKNRPMTDYAVKQGDESREGTMVIIALHWLKCWKRATADKKTI